MQRLLVGALCGALLVVGLRFPSPARAQYFDGGVLKSGVIDLTTSGVHDLVPPVEGQRVRLFQIFLSCQQATKVRLQDHEGTVLQPPFELGPYGIWQLNISRDIAWYMTEPGKGLTLEHGGSPKFCSGIYFYTQGP